MTQKKPFSVENKRNNNNNNVLFWAYSLIIKRITRSAIFVALLVIFFIITIIIINNRMLRLFYGVETFLRCGDFSTVWRLFYNVEFQSSLWCREFSTVWRLFYNTILSEQSKVWRISVQRTSYEIRTHFTVGEQVRSLVLYPFGHRAMQTVID